MPSAVLIIPEAQRAKANALGAVSYTTLTLPTHPYV